MQRRRALLFLVHPAKLYAEHCPLNHCPCLVTQKVQQSIIDLKKGSSQGQADTDVELEKINEEKKELERELRDARKEAEIRQAAVDSKGDIAQLTSDLEQYEEYVKYLGSGLSFMSAALLLLLIF